MRVRVYFNLRKKLLSVMDKATRRVIRHVECISLKDVKFIVSQKGVERIRAQKRKSVVAFVEGDVTNWGIQFTEYTSEPRRVRFNPYEFTTFVLRDDNQPVFSAEHVTINGREVQAYGAA